MMSSKELKNQMQDATNTNLYQADLPNNIKTTYTSQTKDKEAICKTICNDLTNPPYDRTINVQDIKRCDAAADGKCEGEIKRYGHLHFNCLAVDAPGQQSTHNFCKYHYDNATYCPVHPCFNRVHF